jgi:hypothetical protein
MEADGLLTKVAAGTLPMMVVLSDHRSYSIDKMLGDWTGVQQLWDRQEDSSKKMLVTHLKRLSADDSWQDAVADRIGFVTARAGCFEGLMAAWGSGKLKDYDADQLQTLLLRSGSARVYCGMMSILK